MKARKISALVVAILLANAMVARPAEAGNDLPYQIGIPFLLAVGLVIALIADHHDGSKAQTSHETQEEDGLLTQVARSLPCGPGNGETVPLACW